MTEEDIDTLTAQLRESPDFNGKATILFVWVPHIARCMRSTNAHVKALEGQFEETANGLRDGLADVIAKIDSLHKKAKFVKGERVEWVKENWMWVVVLGYIIQSLFGVDVSELAKSLMAGG